MKRLYRITSVLSLFLLLFTFICFGQAKQNNKAIGHWKGLLVQETERVGIILKVSLSDEGDFYTTIYAPKKDAINMPVPNYITDDSLMIQVNDVGLFKGRFASPKTIIGTWYQEGLKYDLTFNKLSNADTAQISQTPEKPYPYLEEEVTFVNPEAGITLSGTLTTPETGDKFPAVILVSGMGDQDRDLTTYNHKPFLVVSDYLTRNGFAVLRFDDRNLGIPENEKEGATLEELSTDVLAAIDFLKTNPRIDSAKIGLVGHGDGGTIASFAANKAGTSAFVVLWGAPGTTGDKALIRQVDLLSKLSGYDKGYVDRYSNFQKTIFDILLHEPSPSRTVERLRLAFSDSTYAKMKPEDRATVNQNVQRVNNTWFKFYLKYDPTLGYKKLQCPVLVITGDKDLEFPADPNLGLIQKALEEGNNKNVKIVEMKGLNHLLQTTDFGSPDEYMEIMETISPKALKLIGSWIKSQVK